MDSVFSSLNPTPVVNPRVDEIEAEAEAEAEEQSSEIRDERIASYDNVLSSLSAAKEEASYLDDTEDNGRVKMHINKAIRILENTKYQEEKKNA